MPVQRHPVAISKAGDPLAKVPLDQALIGRLKESYRLVRQNDLRLAETFYTKLFAAAPQLRTMFSTEPTVQAAKLMGSLDFIVENLVDPDKNAQMLTALGKRHAGYGAGPQHYTLVIDLLIESMRDLLGDDHRGPELDEWRIALDLVGKQMIAASAKSVLEPHPAPGPEPKSQGAGNGSTDN